MAIEAVHACTIFMRIKPIIGTLVKRRSVLGEGKKVKYVSKVV